MAKQHPERFQILEQFPRYKQAEQALIKKRREEQEQLTKFIDQLTE